MAGLKQRTAAATAALLLASGLAAAVASAPAQAVEPGADPFYTYSGAKPLASYAPGDVLAKRTVMFSLSGLPLPFPTTQILYRSTDQQDRPVANVTSVVKPLVPVPTAAGQLVSYQSFYDSLNPADSPSRGIAGGAPSVGGSIVTAESVLIQPLLAAGYTVNIPDTEGPTADFAAGPEYGRLTLDSIRAASLVPETGLAANAPVGMLGYSGGAIATGWAAALAPSYAPDVNQRLVGATEGGVLVAPARNLTYIDGAPIWGGVAGMALVGVARSFGIDFTPYLSENGKTQLAKLENASIGQVLGQYPNFTFASLVKPEYADPTSIEPFVKAANAINLGSAPTPTIPMQIRQGTGGDLEGTPGNKPGIGPGDGVMIAGDVRALAKQYCATGGTVDYQELTGLSHVPAAVPWLAEALPFLAARFAGASAPTNNCASIAPGNSLAPAVFKASGTGPIVKPGAAATRTRVRLPRVWQVRGKESTVVRFAVVAKGRTTVAPRAGRVVVKLDGRTVKTATVGVGPKSGRAVVGATYRVPKTLALGRHTLVVVFTPADRAAFGASRSRTVTLTVVRSRPAAD